MKSRFNHYAAIGIPIVALSIINIAIYFSFHRPEQFVPDNVKPFGRVLFKYYDDDTVLVDKNCRKFDFMIGDKLEVGCHQNVYELAIMGIGHNVLCKVRDPSLLDSIHAEDIVYYSIPPMRDVRYVESEPNYFIGNTDDYFADISSTLLKSWTVPRDNEMQRFPDHIAALYFKITSAGAIKEITVVYSNSSDAFIASCKSALNRIGNLKPLKSLPKPSVYIKYDFIYTYSLIGTRDGAYFAKVEPSSM